MTPSEIEILVGDVNDVEAHVFARCNALHTSDSNDGNGPVVLSGTVRGPYCEQARTLPATFAFRPIATNADGSTQAEAVVPDPCVWSYDLPHVYQVAVEARRGNCMVAEYHGEIGLKRVRSAAKHDFSPG